MRPVVVDSQTTTDVEIPQAGPALHQFGVDPRGLVVVLYQQYYEGIFPMADALGEISWHFPMYRAVFSINRYRCKKSLNPYLKPGIFEVRINRSFEDVIRNCAVPRKRFEGTWLNETMICAYLELHQRGFAHSVEIYQNDTLVGGLYGVHIGSIFFGESMFSHVSNASKVAFHHLMLILQKNQFMVMDSQYLNNHTEMLGAIEIRDFVFKALVCSARDIPSLFNETI
ncbi:MAG: leucyl/phenylalanyl-tRNA--protein transferase [Bacteroidota bacterium]